MKKILLSLMAILLAVGLVGAGAFAQFNDTETSSGNTFTAGTLDMKVDGKDDGGTVAHVNLGNMKPGDDSGYYKWVIKNAGDIPGKLSVTFSAMDNQENGEEEPEIAAEDQPYGYHSVRDPLGHPTDGELGEYLRVGVERSAVEGMDGVTIIDYNDEEGWFIAEVVGEIDTGGTIGWAAAGRSNPSRLHNQSHTGPPAYGNTYGLNSLGGRTFGTLAYLPGDILGPGKEVAFFFRVNLANDLRAWDGCGWHDIDDNVIQGDSVEFDITFKLEQVP